MQATKERVGQYVNVARFSHTSPSFIIISYSIIPFAVSKYFWRGWRGESGYCMRTKPSFIAELKKVQEFCASSFLLKGPIFLEGDAFVEFLVAFGTFWEEVEADAADVLFGAEVL